MSTTQYIHEIKSIDPEIATGYVYGVRYPDGRIAWENDGFNMNLRLIATDAVNLAHYHETLRKRAVEARIDPDEYILGHQLLRRTVVVAVTAPEEV